MKILSQKYIQKKDMFKVLYVLDPVDRGSYEITVACSSFTASVGKYKIFFKSIRVFFSDFLNKITLF